MRTIKFMIPMIFIDQVTGKTGLGIGEGYLSTVIGATKSNVILQSTIAKTPIHTTTHPRAGMNVQFTHALSLANHQHRQVMTVLNRVRREASKHTSDEPLNLGKQLTTDTEAPASTAAATLLLMNRTFHITDQVIPTEACGLMDARLSIQHTGSGPVTLRLAGSVLRPKNVVEETIWSLTAQDAVNRGKPSLGGRHALRAVFEYRADAIFEEIDAAITRQGWSNKNGVHYAASCEPTPEAVQDAYNDLLKQAQAPQEYDTSDIEQIIHDILRANLAPLS